MLTCTCRLSHRERHNRRQTLYSIGVRRLARLTRASREDRLAHAPATSLVRDASLASRRTCLQRLISGGLVGGEAREEEGHAYLPATVCLVDGSWRWTAAGTRRHQPASTSARGQPLASDVGDETRRGTLGSLTDETGRGRQTPQPPDTVASHQPHTHSHTHRRHMGREIR